MKFSLVVSLVLLSGASAFLPTPMAARAPAFTLQVAKDKKKIVEVKEHKDWMDRPKAPKGKLADLRTVVGKLSKENFDTIYDYEEVLTKNVGINLYQKTMKKIRSAARREGVELKADFGKHACCTKPRREKQDSFVQTKLEEMKAAKEEKKAAEEEAAAAVVAEAAAAAEAAATEAAGAVAAVEEEEKAEEPVLA